MMRAFAILPAAGRSRRMGQAKLLLPWGSTSLIEHVLKNWQNSRVERTVVVLHPDDHEIAARCEDALAVICDPPPAEMKDSICRGLQAVEQVLQAGPDDVWLVAPADMPGITPAAINGVIAAYEQRSSEQDEPPRIWAACHAGRRGHPVLFPWAMAREVPQLGPDEGLKSLLSRHPVEQVEVNSSGIFADVDTPEDYERQRPLA